VCSKSRARTLDRAVRLELTEQTGPGRQTSLRASHTGARSVDDHPAGGAANSAMQANLEQQRRLHALLFKEMVNAMMPTGSKESSDKGFANDVWRSKLSEVLAETLSNKLVNNGPPIRATTDASTKPIGSGDLSA